MPHESHTPDPRPAAPRPLRGAHPAAFDAQLESIPLTSARHVAGPTIPSPLTPVAR